MKVVPDTNVLIGFVRDPKCKMEFDRRSGRSLLFLNSIVAMELRAGCRTAPQKRAMEGLTRPFERTGRTITPDHASFLETGRVLAALGAEGMGRHHLGQMANDILIGVSSTRAGAVVITANGKDFSLIEKYTPVRWMLPN